MTSLFGTIRRNFRTNGWKDDSQDVQISNSGFLTSFGNSRDAGFNHDSQSRMLDKKPSTHKTGGRENSRKHRQTALVDHNRNALTKLPNFNEKKIFLPGMNDQMCRTNQCLDGMSKGSQKRSELSLKDYRFLKVLGKGTFAKVRLAEHLPTGHKVAIKVIEKSQLSASDQEKMYREIKIMKCLNHPNIIRLYEVIEEPSQILIVMEFVSRGEIYDYIIAKKRLTEDDARSKFRQLLSAVAYCHSRNVVHRDLKVENLLLDNDHNVKICDFGFGNFFDKRNLLDTFCGSPPYAAPELFRGDKYAGPEVDIWSLGVILYTFLTGSLPFNGKTLPDLKHEVLKGNFTVPNYIRVGSELFLRKFLKLIPSERITLQQAIKEPWITCGYVVSPLCSSPSYETPLNMTIVGQMIGMGFEEKNICESVEKRKYDDLHATYRILSTRSKENSFYDSFKNVECDTKHRSEQSLHLDHSAPTSQSFHANLDQPDTASTQQHRNQQQHHHHHNYSRNTPVAPPRRRRQTALGKEISGPGNALQAKFVRRHSVGIQDDMTTSTEIIKTVSPEKIKRRSSFCDQQIQATTSPRDHPALEKPQTPIIQKIAKLPSRNLFKKNRNIYSSSEECGHFKRVPSISSREVIQGHDHGARRNSENDKIPMVLASEYSAIISHRFSFSTNPTDAGRRNSRPEFPSNCINVETTPNNNHRIHNLSIKQRIGEFFKKRFL